MAMVAALGFLALLFLLIYMFADLPFPLPTLAAVFSLCLFGGYIYLIRLIWIRKQRNSKP